MANPEHLKILKQGVEVWNRWREENPRIRPDLADLDLHGLRLFGAALQEVDFFRTDLSESDLEEANLTRADLGRANLSGSKVSRAKLSWASFRRANLSGSLLLKSDLRGANLSVSSLTGADLRGANLHEANCSEASAQEARLSRVNFTQANLNWANFRGADLRSANLNWADLRQASLEDADLSGALFGGTVLGGIDFGAVRGLKNVRHTFQSFLSVESLLSVTAALPESFLRGIGVPEKLMPHLTSTIEIHSCFVSYSHEDGAFATRLHRRLQEHGVRCWLDQKDIRPGDRILDVVDHAIRTHDRILLCCSETSLNSWWVKDEIRKAQERERRDGRDIIIPLMVDRYLLVGWEDGLAADLRSRLAADFTGWEHDNAKFEEQFERVVKALRADGRERGGPPTSRL